MNPCFQISIMGNFPEFQDCPIEDFLWHGVVSSLPEIGSVLKIDDTVFQVEKICLNNNLSIDEDDKNRYIVIVDVRSYEGSIAPTLMCS